MAVDAAPAMLEPIPVDRWEVPLGILRWEGGWALWGGRNIAVIVSKGRGYRFTSSGCRGTTGGYHAAGATAGANPDIRT